MHNFLDDRDRHAAPLLFVDLSIGWLLKHASQPDVLKLFQILLSLIQDLHACVREPLTEPPKVGLEPIYCSLDSDLQTDARFPT